VDEGSDEQLNKAPAMNGNESIGERIDAPPSWFYRPRNDLNYIKFYRGGHVKSVKATPVPLRLRTFGPLGPLGVLHCKAGPRDRTPWHSLATQSTLVGPSARWSPRGWGEAA